MEPTQKITLYLDARVIGSATGSTIMTQIAQPNGTYANKNHSDWYLTVPFYKSDRLVDEYIHTYFDPFTSSMPRQLINPYFVEYGFFETIKSYSANTEGNDMYNITTKAPIYDLTINS